MNAPLVTIFLFAYNQEKYIESACLSVLEQDYPSLEVILSDDCSSDATFSIMEKVFSDYKGPHRVRLNRNPQNIGLIAHVNLSARLASGELIVAAAGDDISLSNRVSEIVSCYLSMNKKVSSIHSAAYEMSESGVCSSIIRPPIKSLFASPERIVDQLAVIIGATHAWVPGVFGVFGEIECLGAFEDLVISFRSELLDGLCYIDKPLVKYRVGAGGLTSGDWSSASSAARRKRILRLISTNIDVFEQRRKDSLVVGRNDLARRAMVLADRQRVIKLAYEGDISVWRLLRSAWVTGCIRPVIEALLRRLRRRV